MWYESMKTIKKIIPLIDRVEWYYKAIKFLSR